MKPTEELITEHKAVLVALEIGWIVDVDLGENPPVKKTKGSNGNLLSDGTLGDA